MPDRDRRRKRRKRRFRLTGCLCILAAAAGVMVLGSLVLPGTFRQIGSALRAALDETVEETVNATIRQETEFPELTVTAEESESDFYYLQLGEEEQLIYRELLQGVRNMEESILLHAGREDRPEKIYEYLLYDRPELFWCAGSSRMTVYDDHTEFCPDYTCTPEEKAEKQLRIDEAVSACMEEVASGMSEYEKIRYVYEYLIETVDYDETAPDNQNIYSALAGGRSVCAGYSRAAQYLLGELGIECIYVVGTAQGQESHAWNIVNCGEAYYQMDVTFGDPVFLSAETGEELPENIINYDYLCCTDEVILLDHTPSREVAYPVCDSNDLDYYRLNGLYYDSFDAQIILEAMNSSIYAGEEMFLCKFPSREVYAGAAAVMKEDLFPKAARTLASVYGLESVKYTYIEDETHNKIMVFWDYGS